MHLVQAKKFKLFLIPFGRAGIVQPMSIVLLFTKSTLAILKYLLATSSEKSQRNLFPRPGWCQEVVQWSTNSWKCVHKVYSIVQLGPSPFCQTLRQNNQVKFECWINLCGPQVGSMFMKTGIKTICCQPQKPKENKTKVNMQ